MTTDTTPQDDQHDATTYEEARLGHAEETEVERKAREAKARLEHNRQTTHKLRLFLRTMTQGDWLAICRLLDMTRDQIAEDENLTLLAAAYVKDKREHGAASIDVLLELTDDQLSEFHGYQLAPLEEREPEPRPVDGKPVE